jgi:hypothetical protein
MTRNTTGKFIKRGIMEKYNTFILKNELNI